MGSIGLAELLLIGVIAVLLLGAPLAVLVWLLLRQRAVRRASGDSRRGDGSALP